MKTHTSLGALFFALLIAAALHPAPAAAQTSLERVYLLLPQEGNIAVVDPFNGILRRRVQVGSRPQYILFLKDLQKAYVSNTGSNILSIVDVVKEATTKIINVPFEEPGVSLGVLAWNKPRNLLYVAEYPTDEATSANIWVIDVATENIVAHFAAGTRIVSVSVTPDGKKIFVLNEGKSIGVYDADSYKQLTSIAPLDLKAAVKQAPPKKGAKGTKVSKAALPPARNPLCRLACHPTKNLVYVTYGAANQIQIINADSYLTEKTVAVPDLYRGEQTEILCSPDGQSAFIVNHKTDIKSSNSVLLFNTEKAEIVKLFDTGPVRNGLALSNNGKYLFTAGTEFKTFDLTTFQLSRSIGFQTDLGGMADIGN